MTLDSSISPDPFQPDDDQAAYITARLQRAGATSADIRSYLEGIRGPDEMKAEVTRITSTSDTALNQELNDLYGQRFMPTGQVADATVSPVTPQTQEEAASASGDTTAASQSASEPSNSQPAPSSDVSTSDTAAEPSAPA